jgi:hypothetical protein
MSTEPIVHHGSPDWWKSPDGLNDQIVERDELVSRMGGYRIVSSPTTVLIVILVIVEKQWVFIWTRQKRMEQPMPETPHGPSLQPTGPTGNTGVGGPLASLPLSEVLGSSDGSDAVSGQTNSGIGVRGTASSGTGVSGERHSLADQLQRYQYCVSKKDLGKRIDWCADLNPRKRVNLHRS